MLQKELDIFMEQSKRWLFFGAALLAMTAGYINVVMLGFFAIPVSHMSGAVSQLGINIASAARADLILIASMVSGFFLGAFVSGFVLRDTAFKMRRRYGVLLLIESSLLCAAMIFALQEMRLAVPLAAMACGLQNAMASSYRGLTLRTTHVTGVVTDLGALLGNRLRGRQIKHWKFGLLLSVLSAFFVGGLAGALMLNYLGMWALGIAAAMCLMMSSVVFIVSNYRKNYVT